MERNAPARDGTHQRTGETRGNPIQGNRTERQAMPSTDTNSVQEAESGNIAGKFAGNDTNLLIINAGYRAIRTRTYPAGHRSRTRDRNKPRKPRSTRSQKKRFKRLSLAWILITHPSGDNQADKGKRGEFSILRGKQGFRNENGSTRRQGIGEAEERTVRGKRRMGLQGRYYVNHP